MTESDESDLARAVEGHGRRALIDADRLDRATQPTEAVLTDDYCVPCANSHLKTGCADVGCNHNCQGWLDRNRTQPTAEPRTVETDEREALAVGPDGVAGSTDPWASGLRGSVLTALLTSPWAADAGKIRAVLMGSLYAEVDRILARADDPTGTGA